MIPSFSFTFLYPINHAQSELKQPSIKRQNLKYRNLVPTIQLELDFSWTCGFRWMLDNVKLIMYMKFQKILMTGCRDMDKKHQKCPKNVFSPFVTPQYFFFKNRALSLLYPYGALNSCKKIRKKQWTVSEIFKDWPPTTDGQGRLLRTPSVECWVQHIYSCELD